MPMRCRGRRRGFFCDVLIVMKTCTTLCVRLSAVSVAVGAFLSVSVPASALAQTPPSQFATQVVTATRVATPNAQVIADVSVIDRAALDLAGQSSLRDVLAAQAGVQLTSSGGYRSVTGVFLRGASSSQTIVLVDGVRIGSATSGTVALENLPLSRIERIEILRGAASALYGPDAVGGVIQVFTRKTGDGLAMDASIGAGSDGQQQMGASIRGSGGAVGYSLGVSREKASGISVLVPAASSYNPDSDGFTSTSVDAKLQAQVHRDHALSIALMHSETDYQFDGTPYPNPLSLKATTTDAWTNAALNHATLKWDAQWLPQWHSTVTAGSSEERSEARYLRMADGALGGTSQFNTQRKQLTWQNDVQIGQDLATLLLETRNESVNSDTAYTVTSRDVRSLMASYALNRADWNALAVLRNDDNSQFGSFTNWALSAGYRLSDSLRAVGSVGTSFQAPSFNQLYYPGFGNPALQPQQNRATEIGVKYALGALSGSLMAYYNDVQGFILPATNVQSTKAVLRGVTWSAATQVGTTQYSVSYDYADPRSFSTNPAANDLRLIRVAQNVLNFRATQPWGNANVFAELRTVSDREDNNLSFSGRDILPSYTLLNLGMNWKMQKNLSVLARVNNVTDAQYQLANGYAMPGRNLFVSLNWVQ